MSTHKFNIGDKVRCIHKGDFEYLTVGKVYEIMAIRPHIRYTVQNDRGQRCSYPQIVFELAKPTTECLTPEEVFKHLRDGTKLQHLVAKYGWKDVETPDELYYEDICNENFRIKPKPEIITLNGKRYQALED